MFIGRNDFKQAYPDWTLFAKEGLEPNKTWKRWSKKKKLDLDYSRTKKETCKLESAISSRKENLPRIETNAGRFTASFPVTP